MSVAASTAMVLAAPASALASLDTTYSSDGIHWDFHGHGYPTAGHAAAIQPDGKIVTAGYIHAFIPMYGFWDQLHVVRYTASGALDITFGGGDGHTSWSVYPYHARATDVALQPDGKIVVVGYESSSTDDRIFVARLTTYGTLDTSFASGGLAHFDTTYDDRATGVTIDGDGKIIVSGYKIKLSLPDPIKGRTGLVLKLNTNGSLDTSFADSGVKEFSYGSNHASYGTIVRDVGTMEGYRIAALIAERHPFLSDGQLVVEHIAVLSMNGQVLKSTSVFQEYCNSSCISHAPLDHFYAEELHTSKSEITTVLRNPFDSDGVISNGAFVKRLIYNTGPNTLLLSMDTDGTTVGAVSGTPLGLAVLPDGRVVLGGSKPGSSNMELVRYNSDGTLDTSFGNGGFLSIAFSGVNATLHGLAVHSDGRVVGVGTRGPDQGLATFRLQGEGIAIGKKLAFRSHHGKYLVAEQSNNMLKADRTAVGAWERFTPKTSDGDLDPDQLRFGDVISLQSHHGKYVVAMGDGKANANSDSVDPWELVNPFNTSDTGPVTCGATIALRSYYNTYLTAEDDDEVMADRTAIGSWERWQVECH